MSQLPVIVAFLVAFVASFSRIFAASKPFWALFPAWVQVLFPQLSLAVGAIGAGLAGGIHSATDLVVVFVGAGAFLLPGVPSNRSSAPLPTKASVAFEKATKAPSVPPFTVLMLSLICVALCSSCSLFGAHGSVWPALGKCAPTPADLFSKVESILVSGGGYEKDLEDLGKTEGFAFVECAAQSVVEALTAKKSVTPDEAAGVVRGKAFLAKVSAQ